MKAPIPQPLLPRRSQRAKSRFQCMLGLLAGGCLLAGIASGQAPPPAETALPAAQVLIGGALHTCTSLDPDNCLPGTVFPDVNSTDELVSLAANRVAGSSRILQTLLKASQQVAGELQPQLTLVTASSNNAFGAVDFYRQLFEQLGFSVHWLPVDAVLARVLDQGLPCEALDDMRATRFSQAELGTLPAELRTQQLSFCRDPRNELARLRESDAVFFNGGDQSLTLQSLVTPDGNDRPWMAIIRERHAAGHLVLGGTSAGTAVHSQGEMLMGGDSTAALLYGSIAGDAFSPPAEDAQIDGVLFHAQGSGLFAPGILDSHFSERGRWLRLLTLLRNSRANLAFGVDETTALVTEAVTADLLRLHVVGEGGVAVLQRRPDGIQLHYLVEGTEALLQDGELSFTDTRPARIGMRETTLLLDQVMLQDGGLRDWFASLLTQAELPALAHWQLDGAQEDGALLDFSALSLLNPGLTTRVPGFHGLLLRWPQPPKEISE